jgi:hypothetical protein
MAVAFADPPSEHSVLPKRTSESRDRIDLRVDPEFYARIDHHQRRRGLNSISAYIRNAVLKELIRDDAEEKEARRNAPRGR